MSPKENVQLNGSNEDFLLPLYESEDEKQNIEDSTVSDDEALVQYHITSFGADYDAEGLVKRLNREDIIVPSFQRSYVWSLTDASRFIESLLLGLPVPGVFLARDPDTKQLLVIDGQQRLKTLQFFFEGVFNPIPESNKQRVFKLSKVQKQFEGHTYEELSDDDRRVLNDSIVHATIIRQEFPEEDDTSIYHIFERLNTTGRKLSPQEIRGAVYHGKLIALLEEMNNYQKWREIYGRVNSRLKDQELILRFLALRFSREEYEKPMKEFLNKFAHKFRNLSDQQSEEFRHTFYASIDLIYEVIGRKAFRPIRALNAAVFDSVMVGVSVNNPTKLSENPEIFKKSYNHLLKDKPYNDLITGSTSDEANVQSRVDKSIEAFQVTKHTK